MLPLVQKNAGEISNASRINAQVEKIFRDPRFSGSGILKKFLQFIVGEKLNGKSHLLKEYTIALEVLQKPRTFNPQENCIVRIHAARLRKVLSDYYAGPGSLDEIQILLPKGHYIPVFCENPKTVARMDLGSSVNVANPPEDKSLHHTIAVFPFHFPGNDPNLASVADGLGMGLSTDLMKLKPPVSVISYSIMRMMSSTFNDFREWEHLMVPRYFFTGNIQRYENTIRVTVQMVRSATYEQLWCHVYERNIGLGDFFQVQDEITSHVVQSIRKLGLLSGVRKKVVSMSAVA